jgi:hypothetical protein
VCQPARHVDLGLTGGGTVVREVGWPSGRTGAASRRFTLASECGEPSRRILHLHAMDATSASRTGRRSLHQMLCELERAWWRGLVSISRLLWRKDGGTPGWEADMGGFTTVDQDDGCQRRSNLDPGDGRVPVR